MWLSVTQLRELPTVASSFLKYKCIGVFFPFSFAALHSTTTTTTRDVALCARRQVLAKKTHLSLSGPEPPFTVTILCAAQLFSFFVWPLRFSCFYLFFFPLLARWDSVSFGVSDYAQVYMSTAMLSKGFSSHGLEPFFSFSQQIHCRYFYLLLLFSLLFHFSGYACCISRLVLLLLLMFEKLPWLLVLPLQGFEGRSKSGSRERTGERTGECATENSHVLFVV